jgi:hypothetical protein
MTRLRNLAADVLVGVVVILVVWWLLRRVFGVLLWVVNTIVFVTVVLGLLFVAHRLRRR